jgi:hypothetical protein
MGNFLHLFEEKRKSCNRITLDIYVIQKYVQFHLHENAQETHR